VSREVAGRDAKIRVYQCGVDIDAAAPV